MRYRIAPRPDFFSIPECSISRITSAPWPADSSYCATSNKTRWWASISNNRERSDDGRDDDDS